MSEKSALTYRRLKKYDEEIKKYIIKKIDTTNIQANFLTSDGFGRLRYYNGHFQYYDTVTSTWVDASITPDNICIINMLPQTMKKIIGIYDINLKKNKLKFEEPEDTIVDKQVACMVEKVIIRRKLGSVPSDENDGILVTEIERKDFGLYKNKYYIDNSFTPTLGERWYYKAFPVSTTGLYNTSNMNLTSILCKDYYLYGFKIDQTEADSASMITYIEDNENFKSAYMDYTTGTFNYGDWKDAFFMNINPCMLKYDGTVDYYLNPNNYAMKIDGTASDITDVSYGGNAMIQFPKIYWKIVQNNDDTANVYISDKKIDNDFHCWAHIDNNGNEIDYCYMPIYNGYNNNGVLRSLSGKTPINTKTATTEITYAKANNIGDDIIWYTEVYSDRILVNLLLLLIGKSTDTQSVFGNGYYTGSTETNNPRIITGTMDTKGLFWGSNSSSMVGVKVFGMEHWWGNQWRRIAGWINDKGIQKVKMTYGQSDGSTVDGYNTDGSGYITISDSIPNGTYGGYITKMTFTKYGFVPIVTNGSATTYYCDGLWFNNTQTDYARVGGSSADGLSVGAFSSSLNSVDSLAAWYHGVSVSCKPLAK